jgi:hypothetical protein
MEGPETYVPIIILFDKEGSIPCVNGNQMF